MRSVFGPIAMLFMTATPAWAQHANGLAVDPELEQLPPTGSTIPVSRPGQLAESAVGQVGVRQTRAQPDGVDPTARISSRVQNRVDSRIRNRIDRNYDPRTDTTSSFRAAGDEVQQPGARSQP